MAEVPARLQPFQRVLDVPCYRRVDVEARRLVVAERRFVPSGVRMPETTFADLERAAVFDVFVDVVGSEKPCMLAKRDERGVEQLHAVIKLFARGKPEPERIRPRQNKLHPDGGMDVGEQRRIVDEIPEKRHFVYVHEVDSPRMKTLQVAVQRGKRVVLANLDVCGATAKDGIQRKDGLPYHRSLASPSQPIDDKNL